MNLKLEDPVQFSSVQGEYVLLNYVMQKFLISIAPAVIWGYAILEEDPFDDSYLEAIVLGKSQVETTLETCFRLLPSLTGFAKFVALLCKSKRCPASQRLQYLSTSTSTSGTNCRGIGFRFEQ